MGDLEQTMTYAVQVPDGDFAAAPGAAIAAARQEARQVAFDARLTPAPPSACTTTVAHLPGLLRVRIDVAVPVTPAAAPPMPIDRRCSLCGVRPRHMALDVCRVCHLCRDAVDQLTVDPLEKRSSCGTRTGRWHHQQAGEQPCRRCKAAEATDRARRRLEQAREEVPA